jgi:hypothetical protein
LSAFLFCGSRLRLRSDWSRYGGVIKLEDPRSCFTEQLQSFPELRAHSVLSPPVIQQHMASHSPSLNAGIWPQTLAPLSPPPLLSRPTPPCRSYPATRATPSRTCSLPTAPAWRPTDRGLGVMGLLSGPKCYRRLWVSLPRMTWSVDLDLAHGGIQLGMPP